MVSLHTHAGWNGWFYSKRVVYLILTKDDDTERGHAPLFPLSVKSSLAAGILSLWGTQANKGRWTSMRHPAILVREVLTSLHQRENRSNPNLPRFKEGSPARQGMAKFSAWEPHPFQLLHATEVSDSLVPLQALAITSLYSSSLWKCGHFPQFSLFYLHVEYCPSFPTRIEALWGWDYICLFFSLLKPPG